jgi:hypothetical protein
MSDDAVVRDEVRSAIEARRELGDEMEPAVIDAFVERIERRLGDRAGDGERALQRKREHQKEMVLGSMGIACRCSRSPRSSPAWPASSPSARRSS